MLTRIQNYSINDIKDGIRYLLGKASESLEVRGLAIEITQGNQDKIAAIYDWVKQTVGYVSDPVSNGAIELFISPVRMINDYRSRIVVGGDCDDMAILTTALCRSIGIRANVVLIDQVGRGLDHAFCQAFSETLHHWVSIDPSTSKVPLGWDVKYREKIVIE